MRLSRRLADPGPRRRGVSGPVLALGLLAAAGTAAADDCPGPTQAELNACAAAEARRADAALNAAYATLTRRVGPGTGTGEALRAAQRAWLAYRDASCALEAPDRGDAGSALPMVRSGCLARFTRDRVRILEGYLTCEEGDLACFARPAE